MSDKSSLSSAIQLSIPSEKNAYIRKLAVQNPPLDLLYTQNIRYPSPIPFYIFATLNDSALFPTFDDLLPTTFAATKVNEQG